MPFGYFSPGLTIFALVVAGILSLIKAPRKRVKVSKPIVKADNNKVAPPIPKYEGYISETIDISVLDSVLANKTQKYPINSQVLLTLKGKTIHLVADGIEITPIFPDVDSRLRETMKSNGKYAAYIKDRVFSGKSSMDLFTLIVFSKPM